MSQNFIPPSVLKAKEKPGQYALWGQFYAMYIETEEDGTVHQLDFRMQRDGILPDDGWRNTPEVQALRLFSITEIPLGAVN